MLMNVPPKSHKRGARKKRKAPTATNVAPTLVSAVFSTPDGAVVTLAFDRDVELVSFDGSAISVVDGPGESLFDGGGGAMLSGPTTVVVSLNYVDAASGTDVTLTASGATGIVSADGAIAWTGANDVVLPYP